MAGLNPIVIVFPNNIREVFKMGENIEFYGNAVWLTLKNEDPDNGGSGGRGPNLIMFSREEYLNGVQEWA